MALPSNLVESNQEGGTVKGSSRQIGCILRSIVFQAPNSEHRVKRKSTNVKRRQYSNRTVIKQPFVFVCSSPRAFASENAATILLRRGGSFCIKHSLSVIFALNLPSLCICALIYIRHRYTHTQTDRGRTYIHTFSTRAPPT